mmetsp:Transcript_30695/g.99528  ORF Transcript_30695/g.99528 Transcript_30695/m.99528 type:complete len:304 (-) Transcript_30695:165-1076(-)
MGSPRDDPRRHQPGRDGGAARDGARSRAWARVLRRRGADQHASARGRPNEGLWLPSAGVGGLAPAGGPQPLPAAHCAPRTPHAQQPLLALPARLGAAAGGHGARLLVAALPGACARRARRGGLGGILLVRRRAGRPRLRRGCGERDRAHRTGRRRANGRGLGAAAGPERSARARPPAWLACQPLLHPRPPSPPLQAAQGGDPRRPGQADPRHDRHRRPGGPLRQRRQAGGVVRSGRRRRHSLSDAWLVAFAALAPHGSARGAVCARRRRGRLVASRPDPHRGRELLLRGVARGDSGPGSGGAH